MTLSKPWIIAGGVVLALSLALNLLALGALGGRHWAGMHGPAGPPFMRGVPSEARPALRTAFRERGDELRRHREAIHAARAQVAAIIAEPELDRQALRTALDDLAARTQAIQAIVHEVIVDTADNLPPETRAQWRQQWRRSRPHHHREG